MKEKKQNVTRYNSSIFAQKVRLKHDFVVLCLFSFILIDVSMKEQQLREKKKRRTDISRSKRKKNCKSSKTLQLSLPFILFSGQVTSNNITKKKEQQQQRWVKLQNSLMDILSIKPMKKLISMMEITKEK